MPQLGTLLLSLALFVIVGLIIVLPLLDRRRPAVQAPSRRAELEAERQDIVRAIRELDFDHRTRKINDEDYKQLREGYVQRGAAVLRELSATSERDVDAEIEQRVAALRSVGDASARACAACGATVDAADRFCPKCGTLL